MRRGSATPSDWVFETPEALHALRQAGLDDGDGRPLESTVADALPQAIDQLPPADAEAARVILGLDPVLRATRLGERRERAAEALGVAAGTFRNRHEDRLLEDLSQELALLLLSGSPMAQDLSEDEPIRDPSRVLLIHGRDSLGVREVARLVDQLGLQPIMWQEALDRTGLWSPSVIARFRSCLDVAQGVVVVLEGGLGESGFNLVFEAGLALGLAEERTVVVQLGEQTPPGDLEEMNILRLRSTKESFHALSEALRNAGCDVDAAARALPNEVEKGLNAGWYRWTPAHAESPVYADIADAVSAFKPIPTPGGRAAATWLKTKALEAYPAISTYLLMGEGRLDGFVALQAGSVEMSKDEKIIHLSPQEENPSRGAIFIRWIGRHQDAPGTGEDLLVFAGGLAAEVGEKVGSAVMVLEAQDPAEAGYWSSTFPFLRRLPGSPSLWMPAQPQLPNSRGRT